jgi:hypothetical protein
MSSRIWLSAAFAALVIVCPAGAQTTLTRKLPEGAEYTSRISVKTDQKLLLAGQNFGTSANNTAEIKTTIGKRDAEGQMPVTIATELKTVELTLPGGVKLTFDPAKPDDLGDAAGNPIAEIIRDRLKASIKTSFTFTLDKENQVLKVEGVNPQLGASEDDVKQQFAEQIKPLADKAVKKGDTWEDEVSANLDQGQVMKFKRKYTHEGETFKSTVTTARKVQKITAVDTAVEYTVKEGGAFKVTKSDLKIADSQHTILFDPELGRAIEVSSKVRMTGPIALSINGMELAGDLDLTIETKSEEVN